MYATLLALISILLLAGLSSSADLAPGQDAERRARTIDVHFTDASRTALVVEASAYSFVADLVHPSLTRLAGRSLGTGVVDLLRGGSVGLEATIGGVECTSLRASKPARLNIWRHGLYYYEIHLLDFSMGSADGRTVADLTGEIVLYCFADRFHVQAILRPARGAVCTAAGLAASGGAAPAWSAADVAIWQGGGTAIQALTQRPGGSGSRLAAMTPGAWAAGSANACWFAALAGPDEAGAMASAVALARRPLPRSAFRNVRGGTFAGYDPVRGVYVFQTVQAPHPVHFEGSWVNPNEYATVEFSVQNDARARRIVIEQTSETGGTVEAGVVTDGLGWPLPIPVQTCKNFAGENEEPDDTPFCETYFPLAMQPNQRLDLRSLHLFQNWGNRPLKQISSIRFFEHYWHMSTGVTETTCHVPFTKPAYPNQGYNVPDFRGMSGITWLGQPQHHHVALHGFLQYNDGKWRYLRYLGSSLDYVAPCFAEFTTRYVTDDGKVRATVTIFEAPQTDETRTFTRVRLDVDDDVALTGDARRSLKLFSGNTDITRNRYRTLAWTAPDGKTRTRDFEYDGSWPALGEPLSTETPITCLYASDRSNNAFVVRSARGRLGGRDLERLGVSLATWSNGVADHILTTTDPDLRLRKGDWLEADVILMPYGDDLSDWRRVERERTWYGSAAPSVVVHTGTKVADFPTAVRAQNDVAEFTVSGGHNALPIIVRGMSRHAVPLLWERDGSEWHWVNPQVRGGDGYQVQDDPEGGFEFVFTIQQRNGMTHHYMVTLATAEGGIESIGQQNHCMRIDQAGRGVVWVAGPRVFVGLRHSLRAGAAAITATGRVRSAVAVPGAVQAIEGAIDLTVEQWSAAGIRLRVEGQGELALECHGMEAGALYAVASGGSERTVEAARSGALVVRVPVKGDGVIAIRRASQGRTKR